MAWTDLGSELNFLQQSFDEFECGRYWTENREIKSTFAERGIKEIKAGLHKVMFEFNTLRWVDFLSSVTEAYNLRPSSALFNYSPTQAREPHNFEIIKRLQKERLKIYENKFKNRKPKFQVGDFVKLIIKKDPFSRGFTQNFTSHSYPITKVFPTFPPTFEIQGFDQHFYEQQMSISPPTKSVYYVAEIDATPQIVLRSGKIKSGEKRYLIKDRTDPDFTSWKSFEELEKFKKKNLVIENGGK